MPYVIPDHTKDTSTCLIEYTLILTAAKSLTERCINYLKKTNAKDIEDETINIIVDNSLIMNSIKMLIQKYEHDQQLIRELTKNQ